MGAIAAAAFINARQLNVRATAGQARAEAETEEMIEEETQDKYIFLRRVYSSGFIMF